MSCGKRRKWHFWAPKFEKSDWEPCPQTPLVCASFGGPTFLSVLRPCTFVHIMTHDSGHHSLFVYLRYIGWISRVASRGSNLLLDGIKTFTRIKIAAHRLSHGGWLLFAVSPPWWWNIENPIEPCQNFMGRVSFEYGVAEWVRPQSHELFSVKPHCISLIYIDCGIEMVKLLYFIKN